MVISLYVKSSDEHNRGQPNIFKAAALNDPAELERALLDGQSLDAVDDSTGFTPVIIALTQHSDLFLQAAMKENFNPWHRDLNERLAIDHANALGKRDVQAKLLARMYPRPL